MNILKRNLLHQKQFQSFLFRNYHINSVKILFGSQTGTAQMFAEELANEVNSSCQLPSNVVDLQDVQGEVLLNTTPSKELIVFVTACFGEGEPTDNAKQFYNWLMSPDAVNKFEGKLQGCNFAIFGLGNSRSFPERYQAVSKNIEKRLKQLGANIVTVRGEGDDGGKSIEMDFEKWKANLVDALKNLDLTNEKKETTTPIVQEEKKPEEPVQQGIEKLQGKKYTFFLSNDSKTTSPFIRPSNLQLAHDFKNPYYATAVQERDLCPQSKRPKKELEFDISPSSLQYTTGDHIGIVPQNLKDRVQQLLKRLNVNGNTSFYVSSNQPNESIPFPCSPSEMVTIEQVFTQVYDLNSAPQPFLIRKLAEYCQNEEEKQQLLQMTNYEHQAYQTNVKQGMMNIVELLEKFPSLQIPWYELIELLPKIQPRYYSISSSNLKHPKMCRITFGVHQIPLTNNRMFKGLCSNYLASVKKDNQVGIFLRESQFRLPKDPNHPLIMVAGGAGIAPFKGFLEERKHLGVTSPAILFYGVRDETEIMYRDEIAQYLKEGYLTHLVMAFSGQSFNGKPPQMIAEAIVEQKELVGQFLDQGANVYACGGVCGFGESVYDAISEAYWKLHAGKYETKAQIIQALKKQGRIFEDLAD